MATSAQIILIIACASLVDCRYTRERLRNHQSSIGNQAIKTRTTVKDSDAVIFPNDDDTIKKVDVINTNNQDNNSKVINANTDPKVNDFGPLISKIVPEIEVKDIFTNPIVDNTEKTTVKSIDGKESSLNAKKDAPADVIVTNEVQSNGNQGVVTTDVNEQEIKINDPAKLNKTTPEFPIRFGGTGNYILVPVANNAPNYQPILTNANVGLYPNGQGNAVPIAPANSNANTMPQFAANVGQNLGPNLQYSPNVGSAQYAAPNNGFNPNPQTNTYVPANVPNTYVINGQLYAAVTVPTNAQVPSTLYYVNPQVPGYQVSNNVPLYNLVSINSEVSPTSPQVNMNANSL